MTSLQTQPTAVWVATIIHRLDDYKLRGSNWVTIDEPKVFISEEQADRYIMNMFWQHFTDNIDTSILKENEKDMINIAVKENWLAEDANDENVYRIVISEENIRDLDMMNRFVDVFFRGEYIKVPPGITRWLKST